MSTTTQQEATSKSTETFVSALILNLAIAGGEFAAFLLIRNFFPRIYQPRTDLPPEGKRSRSLPRNLLYVIPSILTAKDEDIISANGLDAYLFVRFLRLMVLLFAPIAFFTWTILLPVYGTSTGGNVGLNRFTFGNVGRDQQARYAAPLILVWMSTFYVIYMIHREYGIYIEKRQDFLTSRGWSTKAQSRTVLLTGIPDDYCNIEALQALTDNMPGGVRKIWLARDVKNLAEVYDRRIKAVKKLEAADNKVIKLANKLVRKKKVDANGDENLDATEKMQDTPVLAKYIPEKKRPTHRLGKIPFTGQKVDTISWALEEIESTTKELERERQDVSKYKPKSSAFILFNDQISAHIFAQVLTHELPLRMSGRYINVGLDDVIWQSMNINPYSQKLRRVAMLAATAAIIIFWSPLTAFVTSISNVSNLCTTVSWLSWLCNLGTPLNGIIQGILPPLIITLLFMLVPPIFRLLITFQGTPLRTLVEHSLQKRYFAFLFVQGFIVATLSSGIMAGISQITENPTSTVNLLAENLPKASVFFLTLVVTNGLSGAAGAFLQIAALAIYYVKIVLLGGSPRSIYNINHTMRAINWGTVFPAQSLTVVIALAYSTIAPFVCGFALLTFALWYFCYKYLMIWVMDQPASKETGGVFYYTALNQIFAGLYIEHLCLIGLFFLARNSEGRVSALPEAILMIILLVTTILLHITLNSGYGPLVRFLPLSMADEMNRNEDRYAREMKEERRALLSKEKDPDFAATRMQTNSTFVPIDREAGPKESRNIEGQSLRIDENPYPADSKTAQEGSAGLRSDGILEHSGRTSQQLDVPPLPRHQSRSSMGAESSLDELEGGLNDHAFHHPALWRPQPTVWLIKDDLGISDEAIRNAKAHGVDATNVDTGFNEKGRIEVHSEELPGHDFDPN